MSCAVTTERAVDSCHNSLMSCVSRDTLPPWYVAKTEPREEQSAATWLSYEFGVQTYVPLMVLGRSVRINTPRIGPLMPGYLLLRFDVERDPWRHFVPAGLGLRGLMGPHPERPSPVPDGQVERIQALGRTSDGVIDLRPHIAPVPIGAKIRVLEGPFTELVGICSLSDTHRVVALLAFLGGDRRVTLRRDQVEPVG